MQVVLTRALCLRPSRSCGEIYAENAIRRGQDMPSACGLACEICILREKGLCPADGCVAGTDPTAAGKLERLKAATGHPCLILECAIKNSIDYCSRCDKFPCDIHYQQEIFSRKILDMVKGILRKD